MLLQGCESGKSGGKKLCAKITRENHLQKLPANYLGMSAAQQNFHSILCAIHMQLAGKTVLVGNGRQVFHGTLLAGREDRR